MLCDSDLFIFDDLLFQFNHIDNAGETSQNTLKIEKGNKLYSTKVEYFAFFSNNLFIKENISLQKMSKATSGSGDNSMFERLEKGLSFMLVSIQEQLQNFEQNETFNKLRMPPPHFKIFWS